MSNLNEKIEALAAATGLSIDEIRQKVDAIVQKYNNLITAESAISLIAKELGVSSSQKQLVERKVKLDELVPAMTGVSVIGRVKQVYPPREFTRRDGTVGRVRNIEIFDETGEARVVLWDDKVDLIEEEGVQVGDIIEVTSCTVKEGFRGGLELNASRQTKLSHVDDQQAKEIPPLVIKWSKIEELTPTTGYVNVKAKVIRIFDAREFSRANGSTGRVQNILVKDETGSCRVSFWDEKVEMVSKLKPGKVIYLQGALTRQGWQTEVDLSVGNTTIIEIKDKDPELNEVDVTEEQMGEEQKQILKIAEITGTEKNVEVVGRVTQKYEVKIFSRSDGSEGKVGSLQLADSTGVIRVSFWDEQTAVFEQIKVNDILHITNAYAKSSEFGVSLNCGKYAQISINPPGVQVDLPEIGLQSEKAEFKPLDQITDEVTFTNVHVEVTDDPLVRTIDKGDQTYTVVNLKVDDGTGTARLVAWNEKAFLLENLKPGDRIKVTGVRARQTEFGLDLVLSANSTVKLTEEAPSLMGLTSSAELLNREREAITPIAEVEVGTKVLINATIMEFLSQSCVYKACPQCSRKMKWNEEKEEWECSTHGAQQPRNELFFSVSLEDSTGRIIGVFLGKPAEKLLQMTPDEAQQLIEETNNPRAPLEAKNDVVLHKQYQFSANVRQNRKYERKELFIMDFKPLNIQKEIDKLFEETK